MGIKKIYQLLLKSYIGPLMMTFFIALFILLMQFLWKYIDDLVGKGLEWYIIAKLLFYASSTFVPLALPLAILLSSLMTFGNLGEHYELVAMKASGISLRKAMMPLIILSIFISGFAFFFSNNVLPVANLKFKSLLYDVKKQKLAFNLKEGMFYHGIQNFVIRVEQKEEDGRTIHDVMIYDHSDKMGNVKVTVAKSGIMEMSPDQQSIIFQLFDGYSYEEKFDQKGYRDSRPHQRIKFKEQYKRFNLNDFELKRTDEDLFKNNYQMLNLEQLSNAVDSLKEKLQKRQITHAQSLGKRFYYLSRMDSALIPERDTNIRFDSTILEVFPNENREKDIQMALQASRNISENLGHTIRDHDGREKLIRKHYVVWHKKFTLSIACFILFFVGAPLGAIIRKGGLGFPVVISTFFFVLYHILSMTGEKYANAGTLPIYQGMWIASLVFLPIGIFLTIKATSDSPLFDIEAYTKFFQRIFNRKSHHKQ